MILVGVTGPIASGKSSVCKVFSEMGAMLVDVDKIGHDVLEEPSTKVALIGFFGDEVVDDDGNINRERIADVVFSNDDAMEFLEKLSHPTIVAKLQAKIDELKTSGFPGIVVFDAAMLPKWQSILRQLDFLVLVQSPRWLRVNRLIQDRGIPSEQSEQRMDAQERLFNTITSQIDFIVKNNGDLSELRAKGVKVWLEIKQLLNP